MRTGALWMKVSGPESVKGGIKPPSWSWTVSRSVGWDMERPDQQVWINRQCLRPRACRRGQMGAGGAGWEREQRYTPVGSRELRGRD